MAAASNWHPVAEPPVISGLYLVQCNRPNGKVWISTASYGHEVNEWWGAEDVTYWADIYRKETK